LDGGGGAARAGAFRGRGPPPAVWGAGGGWGGGRAAPPPPPIRPRSAPCLFGPVTMRGHPTMSPHRRVARFGMQCLECNLCKTKCIELSEGVDGCRRCARLGIACTYPQVCAPPASARRSGRSLSLSLPLPPPPPPPLPPPDDDDALHSACSSLLVLCAPLSNHRRPGTSCAFHTSASREPAKTRVIRSPSIKLKLFLCAFRAPLGPSVAGALKASDPGATETSDRILNQTYLSTASGSHHVSGTLSRPETGTELRLFDPCV
jgi:hypothetical protein